MALTSKITAYSSDWPIMFAAERDNISFIFGNQLIVIHHVGSTAVPELAAKPEIDLLVEVSAHANDTDVNVLMCGCGYVRGTDLSEGHHFYRKDVNGIRTHKVHVCETGHKDIDRMLAFRNILRQDAKIRALYQTLKFQLELENTVGIKEYLALKEPFIEAVLNQNK